MIEALQQLESTAKVELKQAVKDIEYHDRELKHALARKEIWQAKVEEIDEFRKAENAQ